MPCRSRASFASAAKSGWLSVSAIVAGETPHFSASLSRSRSLSSLVSGDTAESVPIVVEGLGRRCKQASYYAALDPVALAGLRMASSIHRSL